MNDAEIRDALAYLRCGRLAGGRSRLRAHHQRAETGAGEGDRAGASRHARTNNVPLMEAARAIVETEEIKPKPRTALRELIAAFDPLAQPARQHSAHRALPASCSTSPGTPTGGRTTARRMPPAGSKSQGTRALDGGV